MPDRYSFSSPFSRGNDPWFRVGEIDVTTTVAVIGMGLMSMLVWALEGTERTISRRLYLVSEEIPGIGSVLQGQIWRLVTWPLANEPDFWTIILFAVFYMLGSQLENLMGRRPFMYFLLGLTIIPAVVVTIFDVLSSNVGIAFGLRFVELGVLVAFAAQMPNARFWPGIPAFAIAGLIVGIDLLQALGDRDDYALLMLISVVATSLFGIRAFGYADEVPWIPRLPLPASITGHGSSPHPSSRGGRRPKRRGRGKLSSVPPPKTSSTSSPLEDMEIDALLDQVAERGLDSLTKEQRKRLEEHSKRLRKRREG